MIFHKLDNTYRYRFCCRFLYRFLFHRVVIVFIVLQRDKDLENRNHGYHSARLLHVSLHQQTELMTEKLTPMRDILGRRQKGALGQ